jgi:hypothetical protein
MSNLPRLPEPVRRKLTLQWESLLEKHGFTGAHLKLHDVQRSVKARAVAQAPPARRAYLEASYERSIERVGTAETARLATQRFGEVAESYLRVWAATPEVCEVFAEWLEEIERAVLAEVAKLWRHSEWHSAWFEGVCRPIISEALAAERDQWSAKARKLEMQRLDDRRVEEFSSSDAEVETRLEHGREALVRSHRLRGEIEESRVRTEEMWTATQKLISGIRQRRLAGSIGLTDGLPTDRTAALDPIVQRGDSQPGRPIAATTGPSPDASCPVRRRKQKDGEIEKIRLMARKMRVDGATHQQICQRLQDLPRPPRAEWRHLPWDKAYMHQLYRASVCKWLSKNCQP